MNELQGNTNSQDSSWFGLEKNHHSPLIINFIAPHKGYIEMALRVSKLPTMNATNFLYCCALLNWHSTLSKVAHLHTWKHVHRLKYFHLQIAWSKFKTNTK